MGDTSVCSPQERPGVYNEDMFQGLDFVIAEAGKAGLKVILSLVDNWKYHGGVDEVGNGRSPGRKERGLGGVVQARRQ